MRNALTVLLFVLAGWYVVTHPKPETCATLARDLTLLVTEGAMPAPDAMTQWSQAQCGPMPY